MDPLDATKQRVFNLLNAVNAINNLTGQVGSSSDTVALRQRIMREAAAATALIGEIDAGLRRARVNSMSNNSAGATRELDRLADHYAGVKTRIVDAVRASQQRMRQFRPHGAAATAMPAGNGVAPDAAGTATADRQGGAPGAGRAAANPLQQLKLQVHTEVEEAIAQVRTHWRGVLCSTRGCRRSGR